LCDAFLPFRRVLNGLPTLNHDPQLVASTEAVESDLAQLSDDLDAAGLDDLAGKVGDLLDAIGGMADVLDTEYDSVTDALKHAIEDQNDALDEINSAMDAFPTSSFGSC